MKRMKKLAEAQMEVERANSSLKIHEQEKRESNFKKDDDRTQVTKKGLNMTKP